MKLLQKTALIFSIITIFNACGYHYGYSSRSLPGGYDQLSIPIFKNETQVVGIEPYFTNAIREEFERSKIARVVSKAQAPIILKGLIKRVQIARGAIIEGQYVPEINSPDTAGAARLPKNSALATEYRINLNSEIQLIRASDQKVLWRGNFQNEVVYSAPRIGTAVVNSANANYNDSIFKQKIAELSLVMMEEAHDRVTENF